MATHDHAIVDAMQRRVVQLDDGRVIRDEQSGRYETEQVPDRVPSTVSLCSSETDSRFLIREALINLRRNLLVVLGAVLAVFISLALAFGALVLNQLLRINTLAWQDGVHIIAFLNDEGATASRTEPMMPSSPRCRVGRGGQRFLHRQGRGLGRVPGDLCGPP